MDIYIQSESMIESADCLNSVELVKITDSRDFANLMPRPGWQLSLPV